MLECLKQGIQNMDGKPQTFYTDNEGALNATIVQQYFAR